MNAIPKSLSIKFTFFHLLLVAMVFTSFSVIHIPTKLNALTKKKDYVEK